MENCKQKQCINELSTALLKLLESKGYSPGTLLNYRRILLQISIFMKSRRIENYAESVGDKFMARYNTKKNYSISRQQQIKQY